MDLSKIVRKERKTVNITIRVTKSRSKWLADNNYSPTAIFEEACKELEHGKK